MRALANQELRHQPLTVLVYRIFEVDHGVEKYPDTKEELKDLIKTGKAIVFHQSYAPGAHMVRDTKQIDSFHAPMAGKNLQPNKERIETDISAGTGHGRMAEKAGGLQ